MPRMKQVALQYYRPQYGSATCFKRGIDPFLLPGYQHDHIIEA